MNKIIYLNIAYNITKNIAPLTFSHWPSSCTDVFLDSCCSGTWEIVSLMFC